MPRGGARANSGPPPDPNALRRDRKEDKAGWTILPAEGRTGELPDWPLGPNIRLSSALELAERDREMLSAQLDAGMSPRGGPAKLARLDQTVAELRTRIAASTGLEVGLWETLWRTPQAVAWEQLQYQREVALYVRWQVLAELGDMDAAKEARQWSDRLGLNPNALLRNRWKIGQAAPASTKPAAASPARRRTSASTKARLKVVQGGKGGTTSSSSSAAADDGGGD